MTDLRLVGLVLYTYTACAEAAEKCMEAARGAQDISLEHTEISLDLLHIFLAKAAHNAPPLQPRYAGPRSAGPAQNVPIDARKKAQKCAHGGSGHGTRTACQCYPRCRMQELVPA